MFFNWFFINKGSCVLNLLSSFQRGGAHWVERKTRTWVSMLPWCLLKRDFGCSDWCDLIWFSEQHGIVAASHLFLFNVQSFTIDLFLFGDRCLILFIFASSALFSFISFSSQPVLSALGSYFCRDSELRKNSSKIEENRLDFWTRWLAQQKGLTRWGGVH